VERDERRRADALDRYWDAVQRGETPPRPAEVDDVSTMVIARLGERRASVPPDEVRRRVRLQLLDRATPEEDTVQTLTHPRPSGFPAGPLVPPRRFPRPLWRWASAQLVTALLLLLTLGLGYRAFGPGRPAARPPELPAIVATPGTPTPAGPAEEALLAVALPAEVLPRGDGVGFGLGHNTVPPGTRSRWDASRGACCPGVRIEYVLEGSYAVRAEGPIRVERADGAAAEVGAGTEVVLGPGDAVVSRYETAFESANPGATPVELLLVVLVDHYVLADPALPGWIENEIALATDTELSVPPGPAALRLRRVALAPDAVLQPPPDAGGHLVVTTSPGVRLARVPTGDPLVALRNQGRNPVTLYVATLESAGDGATPAATPAP
jgi:hypothetical protein